jgi:diguanylate cyclase (GGDEF)-like protein
MNNLAPSRVLSALNIAVFERTDAESFRMVGEEPVWLSNFLKEVGFSKTISLYEQFPFLDSLKEDFEAFWAQGQRGFLNSGLWVETDFHGEELSLEALAFSVDGRPCVIIELSRANHLEKQIFLQQAREDALDTYFERKQTANHLKSLALYDALTGLPNLTYLSIELSQKLEFAKNNKHFKFAILYLNIDRFQVVNSSLGYEMGDRLLLLISRRMREVLNEEDILCRISGDEFAILLSDLDQSQSAVDRAHQLLSQMKEPFELEQHPIFITASIGIATSYQDYEKANELLRDSNTAMHHAKASGRGHCLMFENSMYTQAIRLLELENDLHNALLNNEFQVYYQPIISTASNKVIGFESLVRWQHPYRGLIMPSLFMPLAEENDFVLDLDLWILNTVVSNMKQWQESSNYPITINVNLSAKQFEKVNFVESVQEIFNQHNIPPETIKLEITESSMLKNNQTIISRLQQLKEAGFKLSIDDFGTGYSSLSYLQYLPVNSLKIDACFVRILDEKNIEFVDSITKLAHKLGIDVTAEGVETEQQYRLLQQVGCEFAQGYLFSKPLCYEEAIAMVNQDFSPLVAYKVIT